MEHRQQGAGVRPFGVDVRLGGEVGRGLLVAHVCAPVVPHDDIDTGSNGGNSDVGVGQVHAPRLATSPEGGTRMTGVDRSIVATSEQ